MPNLARLRCILFALSLPYLWNGWEVVQQLILSLGPFLILAADIFSIFSVLDGTMSTSLNLTLKAFHFIIPCLAFRSSVSAASPPARCCAFWHPTSSGVVGITHLAGPEEETSFPRVSN